MTQTEWQAERERLSSELAQTEVQWAAFRLRGDWDSARTAQTKFYGLREVLASHDRREPDKTVDDRGVRDLTPAEWQSKSERIAAEIVTVGAEWKILRAKGQWDAAREFQARYHLLRKQLSAHLLIEHKQ